MILVIGALAVVLIGSACVLEPISSGADDGKGDIYGKDERRDPIGDVPAVVKAVVESTALLVANERLTCDELACRLTTRRSGDALGLCEGVPFADQPIVDPAGTAFLVAPDLVATATHLLPADSAVCRGDISVVFGFTYRDDTSEDVALIPLENVYRCAGIAAYLQPGANAGSEVVEVAILRLERAVSGRTPVTLAKKALAEAAGVVMVGHPSGLPTKLSTGVVLKWPSPTWFHTDLDAFEGNSGAPVIDPVTGQVVGMHVASSLAPDYDATPEGCSVPHRCEKADRFDPTCVGSQEQTFGVIELAMRLARER